MINRKLAAAAVFALSCLISSACLAADEPEDPGAQLFLRNCMRCHSGILTGNDLQNTNLGSAENLEKKVRRMQQYTGPMTDDQVNKLVELLRDSDVNFRIEDAKLSQIEAAAPSTGGGAPDVFAELFVRNCAACHSIGGGNPMGGDLTHTKSYSDAKLKEDISRMQARVGPMTQDQINGLTALLKDSKALDRVKGAGYKPVATPAGQSAGVPGQSAGSTQAAATSTPEELRIQRKIQAAPLKAPKPEPAPLLITGIACLVALAIGFGAYKVSSRPLDNDHQG